MGSEAVPLDYIPIAIFALIGAAFGVVSLVVGWLVRPSHPYRAKLLPYESGSPLFSDARIQFPMRYYIIAMLFVIFDIEAVFLFPIAAAYGQVTLFAVVEIVLFVAILTAALAYAWGRGVLEWV